MKYKSSRDQKEASLCFEEVLFSPGYAKDGGLFVPETIPKILLEDSWKDLKYPEIVGKVLRLFTNPDELSDLEIKELISHGFEDFESPQEVIPVVQLTEDLSVAELFHGPTMAFKDLSLVILARLLELFLKKRGSKHDVKILVGTSGDTGPAAAHSIANRSRVSLVLLYPLGRVSEIQELQMLTITANNVHVCAVEGNSDELDQPIKECFQDSEFSEANFLGSFNSLQWGRILLQAAHYIYVYLQCCFKIGDTVHVIVPTGAAGNLAAGYLVHQMGIPVKLIASVNVNDILAKTFTSGGMKVAETVTGSLAPAMDIQAPYNVERLLYFSSGGDSGFVRDFMEKYEKTGESTIPNNIQASLREVVLGTISVSDEDIAKTMKQCYNDFNYIVCPHTATAVTYWYKNVSKKQPTEKGRYVCLATASADKFPEACKAACLETAIHPRIEKLKASEIRQARHVFRHGNDWTSQLKDILVNI